MKFCKDKCNVCPWENRIQECSSHWHLLGCRAGVPVDSKLRMSERVLLWQKKPMGRWTASTRTSSTGIKPLSHLLSACQATPGTQCSVFVPTTQKRWEERLREQGLLSLERKWLIGHLITNQKEATKKVDSFCPRSHVDTAKGNRYMLLLG